MENNETIIIKLYNIYKFIEPDFLKFKRLPCFNNIKDLKDGLNKVNNYIAQEVKEKGFIDTFKKVVSKTDIYNAFNVFYIMSKGNYYNINEDDVIALAENKEYQSYYDAYIKQYSIKCANDLDKNDMNNELLKRVLMVRLNFSLKESSNSKKKENKLVSNKENKSIEVSSVNGRRPKGKRNEYNTSIYEMINAEDSLIDKIISELPEHEQKLIRRRERIGQGYIMKLLTTEEEIIFKNIVDNIKSKLAENKKSYRKVDKNMKRKTFYELVKGNKEEVDKIIETLSEEEKHLIERRENGEILPSKERDQFKLIVSRVKTRLGTRRDQLAKAKLTKTIEKKRTKGKPATSIYNLIDNSSGRLYNMIMSELSKEEKDIVMKREHYILDKKDEDKLTPDEKNKFNYIVQKLKRKMDKSSKENKQIKPKKITPKQLKEELSTTDKKNLNNVGNMLKQSIDKNVQSEELIKESPNEELKEEPNKEFETNYKTLLSIAMKDPRVIQEIDIMDLAMTCFRYGICEGVRKRTCEDIAKWYEITPEEVEEISTRVLKKLYDILVDGIIDSNAKQHVKIANQNNKEE